MNLDSNSNKILVPKLKYMVRTDALIPVFLNFSPLIITSLFKKSLGRLARGEDFASTSGELARSGERCGVTRRACDDPAPALHVTCGQNGLAARVAIATL